MSPAVASAMRHASFPLALFAAACVGTGGSPALAAKSKTPVTARVEKLTMSAQELRIRVRALIRPTLGIVEESGDRSLREGADPVVRRGTLVWKIETTTTLLSTMLRNDPVLALSDAWGYAIQVEDLLARPEDAATYGKTAADAAAAMAQIQARFRAFVDSLQAGVTGDAAEARIRTWARRNPIEGALYRRTSMDSAVAAVLATAGNGGALAVLGSIDETTSDVMTRLDLYTMYVPRLARWEAELAVDDLARGVDPAALIADLDRFTRAADRIATVSESAPELVARELAAALEGLRVERGAVLHAVREERIATLTEVEAIAQRMVDRSSGPLHASVQADLEALVRDVEAMRKRLIDDAGVTLNKVVDHAFVKGVQLLLIAAALAALGLVFARMLRR